MTTPTRYGTSCAEHPEGCFVKFSEYEKVVAERDALRTSVIQECIDSVTELAHPEYSLGWNSAVDEAADGLRALLDKEQS